jgi:hypothetical protein
MTIIDAWIQHPTPAFLGHPMFESLRRWMGMTEVPSEIPLELTTSALEAAGVGYALVSAWWGPEGVLIGNDEVAAAVRRRPDLLAGVASVDLARPMDAVRELRRAVKQLGMRALRVLPWLWNLPPNDRRYPPSLRDYLRGHGRRTAWPSSTSWALMTRPAACSSARTPRASSASKRRPARSAGTGNRHLRSGRNGTSVGLASEASGR